MRRYRAKYSKLSGRSYGFRGNSVGRSFPTNGGSSSSSVRRWSDGARNGDVRYDDDGVLRIYDSGYWLKYNHY